jgi:hypothetical protein
MLKHFLIKNKHCRPLRFFLLMKKNGGRTRHSLIDYENSTSKKIILLQNFSSRGFA